MEKKLRYIAVCAVFLLVFDVDYCVDNQANHDDCKQDYAKNAVDGIQRIDDVVEAEETQRIGNQKAEEHHECLVLFVAESGQFFRVREKQRRSVAHDFK